MVKQKKSKSTAKKIDAKPLTEEQIQEFVKYYKKHKSFPGSKIPCNVTGKLTTCVGPWLIKKIKEFGGPEQLLRNYKCRGALKSQKQVVKPISARTKRKAKINELKDEKKEWNIPKMDFSPPSSLTTVELSDLTSSTCLRPDIFLNNDRFCNGCEFFDVCTNSNRGLKPTPKKKK
jgi:hypothetical protein